MDENMATQGNHELPEEITFCRQHCRVKPGVAIYLNHRINYNFGFDIWTCKKFGWSVDGEGTPCKSPDMILREHEQAEETEYRRRYPCIAVVRAWLGLEPGRWELPKRGASLRLDPGESLWIS